MLYLKLKKICKKYQGNAVMTIFGICILFLIGFASSNPGLATELALGMSIVVHANIVMIILCTLRIYFYVGDLMRTAKMK